MFRKLFFRPIFPAFAAGSVLLLAAIGIADQFVMPWVAGRFTSTVKVPGILGVEKGKAEAELTSLGLHLMLDTAAELSADFPKGTLLFQFPQAGAEVKKGRRVWARMSRGLKGLEAPVLRGMSLRQAQISLEQSGLALGQVRYLRSPTVPTGAVLGSRPAAGTVMVRGQTVEVDISLGSDDRPTRMPTLVGLSLTQARTQLDALRLQIGEIRTGSGGKNRTRTVLSQNPPAGAPLKGEKIDLVVSE
jgi:serine/threonine-protein kinase